MLSGRRLDLLDPSPLDVEICRHRPRPGARGALERPDAAATTPFPSPSTRLLVEAIFTRLDARRAAGLPADGAAARCAGIRHRRHDLAVQGGGRRRLQGGRDSGWRRPSICASACPRLPAAGEGRDQARRQVAAYFEATLLAGFAEAEARSFFGAPRGITRDMLPMDPLPARTPAADFSSSRFDAIEAERPPPGATGARTAMTYLVSRRSAGSPKSPQRHGAREMVSLMSGSHAFHRPGGHRRQPASPARRQRHRRRGPRG